MKTLLLVLVIVLMTGCTTYNVKRFPDGSVEIRVSSTRDLEQPELHYFRDGDDASFDFKAASVDNNTDAFMSAFSGMMGMMQQMMEQQMLMVQPPQ